VSPTVARFHVDTGPRPLFDRVHQVLSGVRRLRLHGQHFAERVDGKDAPLEDLRRFDPTRWELMHVEARTDTGKFVTTTWRRCYPDVAWWVVIGYHDTVQTCYPASLAKRGRGADIVTGGTLWDLAFKVNDGLVSEHTTPTWRRDQSGQPPPG
jgi:hypothetical protein